MMTLLYITNNRLSFTIDQEVGSVLVHSSQGSHLGAYTISTSCKSGTCMISLNEFKYAVKIVKRQLIRCKRQTDRQHSLNVDG